MARQETRDDYPTMQLVTEDIPTIQYLTMQHYYHVLASYIGIYARI
jgi:hypothetical protein